MDYNSSCEACPLHEGARTVCMRARGKTSAPRVLFVGEAPGVDEDQAGRPFVGKVGRVLADTIKAAGITNYALTTAVKCRPPGDRNPKAKEMKACAQYLDGELARMKPQFVVPLGNVALKAITGKTGITKWAGMRIEDDERFVIFPMLNPAALFKPGPDREPKFVADFQALASLLAGKGERPSYDRLTVDEMAEWMDDVRRYDRAVPYTIDLETTHLNPRFGTIVTLALSCEGDTVWSEWSDRLIQPLHALLHSGKIMVAHNATFECKWLLHHVERNVPVPDIRTSRWPVHDTLLFHHLLDENAEHDLSTLAKLHTDMGGYDDEVQSLKLAGTKHKDIDINVLGNYNAGDAAATLQLHEEFWPQIEARFLPVYEDIVERSIWAVTLAEYYGRKIDMDVASDLSESLTETEEDAWETIMGDARVANWEAIWHEKGWPGVKTPRGPSERTNRPPESFNPGSSTQLASFVQTQLGCELKHETDSGQTSAAKKHLTPYQNNEWVGAYLRWKETKTIRNNYLGVPRTPETPEGEGILGYVEPNGFLYGSYLLHGTVTGRLASSKPNLQNFSPILRTIAVSRFPNGSIVEADFSQLELRLAAWASGCRPLIDAYLAGADVHRLTAQRVLAIGYGIQKSLDEITPEERQNFGKRVNFGLLYGAYPKRLVAEWGVTLAEAKKIRDAFHKAYPELGRYVNRQQARAERKGILYSHMGRARRLPNARLNVDDWGDPRKKQKIHALLEASNFGIQSLGNDLNTWAFCTITDFLYGEGYGTLGIGLTHDSGTYDVPSDEVSPVAQVIEDVMVRGVAETFPEIEIPMGVEIKVGPSWGEMETYAAA